MQCSGSDNDLFRSENTRRVSSRASKILHADGTSALEENLGHLMLGQDMIVRPCCDSSIVGDTSTTPGLSLCIQDSGNPEESSVDPGQWIADGLEAN
jgi:hypothetical protein